MKNILFLAFLFSCTSTHTSSTYTADMKEQDEMILNSIDAEPMRMGTKEVQKEAGITTEIWTYSESHGSPHKTVETLIHKNGKLVSQTLLNSATGMTFSRQFQNDKVVTVTQEKGKTATVYYLDSDQKLSARLNYNEKNPECFVYDKDANPTSEKFETCEAKYNNAP